VIKRNFTLLLFLFQCCSSAFPQLPYDNKVRLDSVFDKVLRQGDLESLLSEIPNRPDLQLERLAAYFFHQRINQYRLDNKLTTLYWDERMWLAARNHNVYMMKTKCSHEETKGAAGFTGINPSDRIQFVTYNGFKMSLYAENILMNFTADYQRSLVDNAKNIADESFEQWRNSPPHNKNMLHPNLFAHGTSFYGGNNKLNQIFGTTNFGNASDFVKQEISITWNDSLAKRYPPRYESNRKPIKPVNWSVQQTEKELFNVVKARMPKPASAYNADLTLAAEMGIKSRSGKEITKDIRDTKSNYQKATTKPDLKLMLSKLHEKVYRFEFSKEQLLNKSALKVIDDRISKDLPDATKIKFWGGKCVLTESDKVFLFEIDLIYVIDK